MLNLLFICSRNQWRSPTAEAVYKNVEGVNARSAGTEPAARARVSAKMLEWADIVFVMEQKHKIGLKQLFPEIEPHQLVVLDIPDEYQYMDEELVEMIKDSVDGYIG